MKLKPIENAIYIFAALALFVSGCKSISPIEEESYLANKAIKEHQNTPPPNLYHFGGYNLLKNNDNKVFTAADFGAYFSGYLDFRDGLYVSQHPSYNEAYAKSNLGEAWIMEVLLKKSCRKRGRYAGTPQNMVKDPTFKSWISRNPYSYKTASDFRRYCVGSSDEDSKSRIDPFATYMNSCAGTMYEYFKAHKVGIVYDINWPGHGYWYIREPSCILRMESDPSNVLKVISEQAGVWDQYPFTSGLRRGSNGAALYAIVSKSLHMTKTKDYNRGVIKSLSTKSRTSTLTNGSLSYSKAIPTIMDAALRCHDMVYHKIVGSKSENEKFRKALEYQFNFFQTTEKNSSSFPSIINNSSQYFEAACKKGRSSLDIPALHPKVKIGKELKVNAGGLAFYLEKDKYSDPCGILEKGDVIKALDFSKDKKRHEAWIQFEVSSTLTDRLIEDQCPVSPGQRYYVSSCYKNCNDNYNTYFLIPD